MSCNNLILSVAKVFSTCKWKVIIALWWDDWVEVCDMTDLRKQSVQTSQIFWCPKKNKRKEEEDKVDRDKEYLCARHSYYNIGKEPALVAMETDPGRKILTLKT